MSPTEPLSPLSPMDLSPLSPSFTVSDGEWPRTPVLTASSHLPRLVTSFQSGVVDSFRRLSTQFSLPTPSPLSLCKTPMTALPLNGSMSDQRGTPISSRASRNSIAARSTSLSSLNAALQDFDCESLPIISPVAERQYSCLRRENAMEGPDEMMSRLSSPIIEQVISLPRRSRRSRASMSAETAPESVTDSMSSADQITTTLPLRPSTRVEPRSPITKHKRWRQRRSMTMSATPSAKIYVRKVLTRQQEDYRKQVAHLSNELQPLISVRTGQSHPEFPRSLLQYHLLTHAQLDSLARWYHQTIDAGDERWMYPASIEFGKAWCGSVPVVTLGEKKELIDLVTKRRRWGRFIGLKGCDSPVEAPQESLTDGMEREWRESIKKSEDEMRMREKLWGRRFG